jgi:peptide/nickel transport system substrate-binding protein
MAVVFLAVAALDGRPNPAGDRLVAAVPPPPLETNRIWASGWANLAQFEPVLETLLEVNPETGEIQGRLAERWERRDNDREWVFFLRQGVQFHHGYGEMTAADVQHTWELLKREDSGVNQALVWRNQVSEVEILDDYTIAFRFHVPMTFGNQLFSRAGGELYIQSKRHWDEGGGEAAVDQRLVGTGAYYLVERVSGQSMLVRAFDDHWSIQPEDLGFREILFDYTADNPTRLAKLVAGEAHVAEMSADVAAQAEQRGMRIITSTLENMQRIIMFGGQAYADDPGGVTAQVNDRNHPLSFREVRHAIALAIDLEEIHREVYRGRVAYSHNTGWHPSREVWNPEWESRFDEFQGYDPERARQLLAEAGFAPGEINLTVILTTVPAQPEARVVAEAIPGYLSAIGINTTIREVDFGTYIPQWQQRDTFDQLQVIRNRPIRPTEQYIRDQLTYDGALTFFYADQFVADRFAELEVELDGARRNELSLEIGNHVFEQVPYVMLGQTFGEMVVNPAVVADWVWDGQNPFGASHWYDIQRAE